jgi:O-antigen/teichoic acid export membrane protein
VAVKADLLDSGEAGGRYLRGAGLRLAAYAGGILFGLAATPFVTRRLGSIGWGRYASVTALIFIVSAITEGGLANLGVREFSSAADSECREYMRSLLGLRIVLTAVAVVGAVGFALLAYPPILVEGTAIACGGLLLTNLQLTLAVALTARLRLGWLAVLDFLGQAVTAAAMLTLVLTGAPLQPFFAVTGIVALVTLAVTAGLVRGHVSLRPAFDRARWRALLSDSFIYAAATALGVVYFRIVVIATNLLSTPRQTGYFGLGFRILDLVNAVPWLVGTSAFPILARAARDDTERLRYALQRLIEGGLILGAWIALGLVIGAPFAVSIVGGHAFRGSVVVLRILGAGAPFTFLVATFAFVLLSVKLHRALVVVNGLIVAAAVLLSVVLIPTLGAKGAAIVTVSLEAMLAAGYVAALVRARPVLRPSIVQLPPIALAAALAFAVALIVPVPPVAAVAIGSVVLGGALHVLRAVPGELAQALPSPPSGFGLRLRVGRSALGGRRQEGDHVGRGEEVDVRSDPLLWPLPPAHRQQRADLLVAEPPTLLAGRHAERDRVRADVGGDERSGADHRSVADRHPGQDHRLGANPDVVADHDVALVARMPVGPGARQIPQYAERVRRDPVRPVVAADDELDATGDRAVVADPDAGALPAADVDGEVAVGVRADAHPPGHGRLAGRQRSEQVAGHRVGRTGVPDHLARPVEQPAHDSSGLSAFHRPKGSHTCAADKPPRAPQILFLHPGHEDYLADSLFHGLRTLLGANVLDYPKIESLYDSYPAERRDALYGRGFTLYGLLDDLPLDRNRVLDRAAAGEFDLVVFADIWRMFGAFAALAPCLRGHTEIAVLDGADRVEPYPYAGLWWRKREWWTLPRAHTRGRYFKRELTPWTGAFRAYLMLPPPLASRLPSIRRMQTISFSIPEEKLVPDLPRDKDRLLSSHVVDREVAARIGGSTTYVFDDERAYYADLRRSRFGITTKRAGWDCLRHYEQAANGCVPCFRDLDRKPPRCAPHGLDDNNCVVYHDAGELLARLATIDETEYARLQTGALAWARANTTAVRARAFLAACRANV